MIVVKNGGTMDLVREIVKRVAHDHRTILLSGEDGAGKSFLGWTLHRLSGRSGTCVVFNCRELSAERATARLFGREGGDGSRHSFHTPGMLEQATGGTLVLENIDALPRRLLDELFRSMETGGVIPVGGTRARDVDVRFVLTTTIDLQWRASKAGIRRFAPIHPMFDLALRVPPLRERADEISELAQSFVDERRRESVANAPRALTARALDTLRRYSWPGNLDELREVIRRAAAIGGGPVIRSGHLTVDMRRALDNHQPSLLANSQTRSDPSFKCSFCDRPSNEVDHLISGPRVFICDACVQLGREVLEAAAENDQPPGPNNLRGVACSFCRRTAAEVAHLVSGGETSSARNTLICDECLDLADDILAGKLAGEPSSGASFTVRATHAPKDVEAKLAGVRKALQRREISQIAFPIVNGRRDQSTALLAQFDSRLADIADTWQRAFAEPRALILVALPKPRRPSG
jgi:hypothetical protein